MRKRHLIALFAAFVLTFGAVSLSKVESAGRAEDKMVDLNGGTEMPKKGGNRFARVFKAPFKAIGKLFGRGKDDDDKPHRLTEKDAKKFKSTTLTRVNDGRAPVEPALDSNATARDHLARGRALLTSGKLNDAIAELSIAASLDPELSDAHNLLGVAYDRKGLSELAQQSFERSLRAEPNDAQTLNNLGYSLYRSGAHRAALERLKRAAKLAPNDQRILNNLALTQCQLGKYDDAYKNFARAGGEFTGRLNVAKRLELVGREEDAIKHYEAARRIQPTSVAVLRRLANLYDRAGRRRELEAAQQALVAAGGNAALDGTSAK